MSPSTVWTRRKPAGFTLLEVGMASVLVAMLGSGVLMFISDQLRTSEAQSEGTALVALNDAVNGYEAQFAANLANHTAVPIPGYANVANPYSPTPTELTELGLLKSTVPTGLYGISINPAIIAGEPSGLTWIIQPFTDNLGHPSQDLAGAAMISAGGDAAISTAASPSVVTGVGGWSTTNPQTNTVAILAMRNGAGSGAFLKLNGSTPMQGNLNMGTFSMTNATAISANGAVSGGTLAAFGGITAGGGVSAGGGITAAGAMAAGGNVTGANLAASGNTSGATLTAAGYGDDVFFGSSMLYSDGWNSAIRQNGGLYIQTPGGAAAPINQVGDIGSVGEIATNGFSPHDYPAGYAGGVRTWDVYAGGTVGVGTSIVPGYGFAAGMANNGNIWANGTLTANQYVQINGGANQGWGCGPNGLVGRDGSGSLLSCVNGAWQYPGGSVPSGTMCGSVTINGYTNQPSYPATTQNYCQGYAIWAQGCPAGYSYTAVFAADALWMFTCIKN